MADKEPDLLREMAQHRGFKLVKSRRRRPGGDFGRYGLKAAQSGDECLGFGKSGLTATADEIETFLREQTTSTWKSSLGTKPKSTPKPENKQQTSQKPRSPSSRGPRSTLAKLRSAPAPAASPQLRVREADSADSEALARLVSPFAETSAEDISERLPLLAHAGERPLVARFGDEVVGLITWHVMPVLHRPRPIGRITYLQVDEKFRKQGIGRQLVTAVEERLRSRGCGAIEVTPDLKLTEGHKFYQQLGFERTSYRFAKFLAPADRRKG